MKSAPGKSESAPLEAVIFDCDGTLVDSESLSITALIQYTRRFGVTMDSAEAVRRFSGQDLKLVLSELESTLDRPLPEDAIEQFRSIQMPMLREQLQPIEGAPELLGSITLPFCVASNAPQDKIRLCLETTGLIEHVADELIFSAYDIERWKPDPSLFQNAAQTMGVGVERCAVVEDSVFGIKAGLAAGMATFAYDPHHRFGEFGDQITRVERLSELSEWF